MTGGVFPRASAQGGRIWTRATEWSLGSLPLSQVQEFHWHVQSPLTLQHTQ